MASRGLSPYMHMLRGCTGHHSLMSSQTPCHICIHGMYHACTMHYSYTVMLHIIHVYDQLPITRPYLYTYTFIMHALHCTYVCTSMYAHILHVMYICNICMYRRGYPNVHICTYAYVHMHVYHVVPSQHC